MFARTCFFEITILFSIESLFWIVSYTFNYSQTKNQHLGIL